ncbi:MAG TPA: hypothetical protein VM534_03330 [Thermoanaerobaculia bacterium]|nr:hypothetical protein [Thermoanaerobaculia bacterium]
MTRLPVVLASSVIRSAFKGESHGGLYLVDLEEGRSRQVYDWDDASISWEGRGHDRGLRGIGFWRDSICVAASDEIFFFDQDFRIRGSIANRYLKHCHEIHVSGSHLWAASTGFDSVLELDLDSMRWVSGFALRGTPGPIGRVVRRLRSAVKSVRRTLGGPRLIRRDVGQPRLWQFDPEGDGGPSPGNLLHLNQVWAEGSRVFVCGTYLRNLLAISGEGLELYAKVPEGTHNARPIGDEILVNETSANRASLLSRDGEPVRVWPVPRYVDEALQHRMPDDHARQGFARGLAVTGDLLVVGSSPATITAFRLGSVEPVRTVNLTMDVRNSIHGLEIWPFGS